MYREINIPSLPADLKRVTDATYLGNYNKVIVCYDQPWWRKEGFNGFCMSYEGGPLSLARDTSVEERRLYALTIFVQGDKGLAWTKLHPHERRTTIIKQLATIFNQESESEVYRPIEVFEQIWKHEQFSRGALVPITPLGYLTRYAMVYGKPVGNLHFVGTEYAQVWKGYMEGALDSGARGAEEVIAALEQMAQSKL